APAPAASQSSCCVSRSASWPLPPSARSVRPSMRRSPARGACSSAAISPSSACTGGAAPGGAPRSAAQARRPAWAPSPPRARAPGGKSALVEAKAVDGAYPLYGEVVVAEPKDAGPIWRKPGVIVAERSLLERLNIRIGSTVSIGDAIVTIGGILGTQPDRLADRLAYGPRVLMSLDTLDRTGLIQPGSLIRWIYRLQLAGERGNDRMELNTARFTIEAKFPESGFAITDWTDPVPSIRREVKRFTQFISLVGL